MTKLLTKFNVENCDIRTQLMFEDWATIPAYKIVTLLLARKGKSVFSSQGIGEMLEIPKSTVIHALRLLIENEYIIKEGSHYYLNLGVKIDQPIGQPTNPLVDPTNPLVSVDQPIGQESTNPLVTNNDKEIIKKNNDKENKPDGELESYFYQIAENSLTPTSDPSLQSSNQFINLGRRPLKNYPEIKLTTLELVKILKDYHESGIPIDDRLIFLQAFENVASRIRTKAAEGQSVKTISAYAWLTGFAKIELMKVHQAKLDLERSEIYNRKARA